MQYKKNLINTFKLTLIVDGNLASFFIINLSTYVGMCDYFNKHPISVM